MSLKTDFELLNSVETLRTMRTSKVGLNTFYNMKGHGLLRAREWHVVMSVRNVTDRVIHLNTWFQLWLTLPATPCSFLKRGILRSFYCSKKDTENLLDFGAHSLVLDLKETLCPELTM